MTRIFIVLGSALAFLAVALGAFAAHALKNKLSPELFNAFEVGVRYHLYHAFGLFVVAWVMMQFPAVSVSVAGWLFILGIVVFSGSLYALSLTGMKWLGMCTPFGGLCFLGGWTWLGWSVWKSL